MTLTKYSVLIIGIAVGASVLVFGHKFRLVRVVVHCQQVDQSIHWVQQGELLDAKAPLVSVGSLTTNRQSGVETGLDIFVVNLP